MKRNLPIVIVLALAAFAVGYFALTDADQVVVEGPPIKVGATSSYDIELEQGDSNVLLKRPVFDDYGNPVDLTGATIRFTYRINNQTTLAVTSAGAIVGPGAPWFAGYTFSTTDTATPGVYNAQFMITLPVPDGGTDASQQTFAWPRGRFITFKVRPSP